MASVVKKRALANLLLPEQQALCGVWKYDVSDLQLLLKRSEQKLLGC